MSSRYLAVIKGDSEEFAEYLNGDDFHNNAEVFCLADENYNMNPTGLFEIDKGSIRQLDVTDSRNYLLEFNKCNESLQLTKVNQANNQSDPLFKNPTILREMIDIYTDGACDIEEDPNTKINWAGPRAGMGVYFDVPNFKNHISCYVDQQFIGGQKDANIVIELAEAQALLAALVLIRKYKYKWIIIHTDCKNTLQYICQYIHNQGNSGNHLTETFDMLFYVLFTALSRGVNVILKKVKSHSDIPGNDNADHLAKNGKRQKYTILEMITFMESFKNKKKKNSAIGWTMINSKQKTRQPQIVAPKVRTKCFWIASVPHCIKDWQIEAAVGHGSNVSDKSKNNDFHKRDVFVVTTEKIGFELIAQKYFTFGKYYICFNVFPEVAHCNICFLLGHTRKNCNEPMSHLCTICSNEGHDSSQCTAPKKHLCYNCRRTGLPEDHSTFSNECPHRMEVIEEERNKAQTHCDKLELLKCGTTSAVDDKRKM